MQNAPSNKQRKGPAKAPGLTAQAVFAGAAALFMAAAAATVTGATASESDPGDSITPTLAELLADGFAISAMSQGAIGSTVSIAVQRESVAFLCEVERGEGVPSEGCQPLSGKAYLATWRERRVDETREAVKSSNEALTAAMNDALYGGDRLCAFDLQQVIEEAVWAVEQQAGPSPDAPEKVKTWLLGRSGLSPLGDPSENILRWTGEDACPPGLADERLAEIRAMRRAEVAIRKVFSEFEGCVGSRETLSAALDAAASETSDPDIMKQASRLMLKRGAVREESVSGVPHFRLTKGCP